MELGFYQLMLIFSNGLWLADTISANVFMISPNSLKTIQSEVYISNIKHLLLYTACVLTLPNAAYSVVKKDNDEFVMIPSDFKKVTEYFELVECLGSGKYNTVFALIQSDKLKRSNNSSKYVLRVAVTADKIDAYVGTRQLVKLRLKLRQFLKQSFERSAISEDNSTYLFLNRILTDESFYKPEYNKNKTMMDTASWLNEQKHLYEILELQKTHPTILAINEPLCVHSIVLRLSRGVKETWSYSNQLREPFRLHIEIQNRYSGSLETLKQSNINLRWQEVLKLFYGYWHDQFAFLPRYHLDATLGNIFYNITTSGIQFYWADFGCPRTWNAKDNAEKVIYCDWYTNPVSQFFEFCDDMLNQYVENMVTVTAVDDARRQIQPIQCVLQLSREQSKKLCGAQLSPTQYYTSMITYISTLCQIICLKNFTMNLIIITVLNSQLLLATRLLEMNCIDSVKQYIRRMKI